MAGGAWANSWSRSCGYLRGSELIHSLIHGSQASTTGTYSLLPHSVVTSSLLHLRYKTKILVLYIHTHTHTVAINYVMGGDANWNRSMPTAANYPKLAAGPVGKQIDGIYRDRLRQFVDGGQYREQGLLAYVSLCPQH